jgi:hypothetical protein
MHERRKTYKKDCVIEELLLPFHSVFKEKDTGGTIMFYVVEQKPAMNFLFFQLA